MALRTSHRINFETLEDAFKAGRVCLLEGVRKADNKRVALICAVNLAEDVDYELIPFAVMVEGNPFEDFISPLHPDYEHIYAEANE